MTGRTRVKLFFLGIISIGLVLNGCGKNNSSTTSTTADKSGDTSEVAVAAVGGAVSSTASDSVAWIKMKRDFEFAKWIDFLSPVLDAYAAIGRCPTALNAYSGTCTVSGQAMTLTFPSGGCVYGAVGVGPIWVGGTVLTTGASDQAPVCGTYPAIDGATITSLTRTYLGNLLNSPSSRTNAAGSQTVVIDTSAPSSTTFANAKSISPASGTIGFQYSIPAGGGYSRSFVSATAHNLTVTARTVGYKGSSPSGTVNFDHTVSTTDSNGTSTPLDITVSGSGTSQTHTVNGTIHLQHNLLKMTASAAFSNVVHPYGCCYPDSGSVTTTFSGSPNDGKHESMEFSTATCTLSTLGQVQFTNIDGTVSTKTLKHCF